MPQEEKPDITFRDEQKTPTIAERVLAGGIHQPLFTAVLRRFALFYRLFHARPGVADAPLDAALPPQACAAVPERAAALVALPDFCFCVSVTSWNLPRHCGCACILWQSALMGRSLRFWSSFWTLVLAFFSASGHSALFGNISYVPAALFFRSEPAPTFSSSYWSISDAPQTRRVHGQRTFSRFCALTHRLQLVRGRSAFAEPQVLVNSPAAFSASVFGFFFLGTDCLPLALRGERVFLADDLLSLMFQFRFTSFLCALEIQVIWW